MPTVFFPHEKETVFTGSYFANEKTATSGEFGKAPAIGAGTKPFCSLSVSPQFEKPMNNVNVPGVLFPTAVTRGVETTTWTGQGNLSYEEFEFFSGYPFDASGEGGVVSDGPSDPNSFTLYHDKLRAVGCAVSSFSINADPEQIQANVTFIGKAPEIIADGDSASLYNANGTKKATIGKIQSPTLFEPNNTEVVFEKDGADYSSPAKLNAWTFELNNLWSNANFINQSQQTIVQTQAEGNFSLTLPLESNAYQYLGEKGVISATISNSTPVGDYNYCFSIQFNFLWQAPESPSDTNGVWTIGLKGTVTNKETTNSDRAVVIKFWKESNTQSDN